MAVIVDPAVLHEKQSVNRHILSGEGNARSRSLMRMQWFVLTAKACLVVAVSENPCFKTLLKTQIRVVVLQVFGS